MNELVFKKLPSAPNLTFGAEGASSFAPGELVFKDPPSSTALLFGADTDTPSVPVFYVQHEIPLAAPSFSVSVSSAPPASFVRIADTFAEPAVAIAVAYDNRVRRYKACITSALHEVAAHARLDIASEFGVSAPNLGGTDAPHEIAARLRGGVDSLFGTSTETERVASGGWEQGVQREILQTPSMETAERRLADVVSAYLVGLGRENLSTVSMEQADHRVLLKETAWQVAAARAIDRVSRLGAATFYKSRELDALWEVARHAPNGITVLPGVIVVTPPHVGLTDLLFQCPPGDTALLFGPYPCGIAPPAPGTVVVPIRKVYMIINNASLRRVDGNIALPVFNMSLSIDADSWTWSFSAALPGSALSDLEPSESGAPVEVEAMINGVSYRALVERVGRERSFGKSDIRVSGRGKTALLDSPYAPSQSFSNSAARTAQQLMADVLTVNGQPMDWGVNFGLDDWLVPAGVFSQQGSYIAALNAIASAAGGYIQPHASLQSISVLPRYPVAPWDWASVTPDFDLPSDVTTREAIEWVEKARYNRVFVSGQQSGVLGQVTRAGTAGDLLAPMITDALITTASAARQRGLSVLADTGRQAELSLRLPVLAETGVITPGKFVRYTDAGATRVGIVRSVGVEVGMPEIWQTLGVQTYA